MSPGAHLSWRPSQVLELTVDYVVVGSGAGGSAAAVTLARAGREVALIERGPWRDPQDYPSSMLGTMRDMFDAWGATVAVGDSIMPVVQASLVGGTTVINSAIVVRTPGDVLALWRDQHGLGEVFSERAVGEAQDAIERELQVAPSAADPFGRSAQLLLDTMQGRGMEVHRTARNVHGCRGSGQCLQGCRNRAKRSTNLNWIPEVMARGGQVLSCAAVQRVDVRAGLAVGVRGHFVHPDDRRVGAPFIVRARRGVLLAASATGSAPLLWRSGIRPPWLGEGWRAHPGAGVLGVYPEPVDMFEGPTQAVASVHHRLDVGVKLEHLSLPLELIAGRASGAGEALMQRLVDFRHQAMWVSAVRAEAVGRIRPGALGGVSIRYRPTRRDLERLRTGSALLAELHFASGARAVRPGVIGVPPEIGPDQLELLRQAPLDNRAWTWVLSHLFGGCAMGADPQRSVVAPDLHVRGVRGLHVVDASAIPTTLGVNPQHTIMALARVVAERIVNEEPKREAQAGADASAPSGTADVGGPANLSLAARLAAGQDIEAIAAWLDALPHAARLAAVRSLKPAELASLYAAARGRHCDLSFFVPERVPAGGEVVHHGINSLPVIGGTFRKRFSRVPDQDAVLCGYNDNDGFVSHIGWFTGPGYFVVRPRGCPNPDGRSDTDQLFINYYEQPQRAPLDSWPDPAPPIGLTASLVFGQMCDYMWAVSAHVSIGAAFKKGRPVGQYFALVREDLDPS